MLQRLRMRLAQVKAGNTSENLLYEIYQIIYYFYQAKEITKKLYNNIINSIKLQQKINTIFINSEKSKICDPHRLLINISDKMNLKRSNKYVALSNLRKYFIWKI